MISTHTTIVVACFAIVECSPGMETPNPKFMGGASTQQPIQRAAAAAESNTQSKSARACDNIEDESCVDVEISTS
jgi:hypothetical protein